MRYALYPGCIVLYQMHEYERSARHLLTCLGLEIQDIEGMCCCGSLLEDVTSSWVALSAYNMAKIESINEDMKILTLCGACTNAFSRARFLLLDRELREKINKRLSAFGLEYNGKIETLHILELLYENRKKIEDMRKRELRVRCAVSYPCQVFHGEYGSVYSYKIMKELLEITGAKVVYDFEKECCGSSLLLQDENMAFEIGKRKMDSARKRGADIMVDACGNCHLLFNRYGKEIEAIPTFLITQIIGVSVGLDAKQLGLKRKEYEML
jgi:heterodisulfide reductase subunit B